MDFDLNQTLPLPADRLSRLALWWRSFRGRVMIQLPWVLCFTVFYLFMESGQGLSLVEYPATARWACYTALAVSYGIAAMSVEGAVGAYEARVAPTSPYVSLRAVLWPRVGDVARLKPKFRASTMLLGAGMLGVVLARVALTTRQSEYEMQIASAFILVVTLLCLAVLVKLFTAIENRWLAAFVVPLPPLVMLSGGAFAVVYEMDWLVGLGALCVVGVGLISLAALMQTLFVTVPWIIQAPAGSMWVVVAGALLIHLWQEPVFERVNPLLKVVPKGIQSSHTSCSTLIADGGTELAVPTAVAPSERFLISAEGGGLRAAYWTAVSLEALSKARNEQLLGETGLLSGVSGGSLGVATWLAAQRLPSSARMPCIKAFLAGDFLTPLAAGLIFIDVPRLLIPKWLVDKHRGDYFEAFIARRWLALTGDSFFYEKVRGLNWKGSTAKVYFNATDALSGQFIAFGNDIAPPAPGASGPASNRLNRMLQDKLGALSVAQAVHMSARFSYLSPSPDVMLPADEAAMALFNRGDIQGTEATRVASLVDGGYVDNSGLSPALRLVEDQRLDQVPQRRSAPRYAIHLVNAQDRNCEDQPTNSGCRRATDVALKDLASSGTLGWLSRPFDAILAVRERHSTQRLNEMRVAAKALGMPEPLLWSLPMPEENRNALLNAIARAPFHGRDLTWSQVALGWTLAPSEREFMDEQATRIAAQQGPK